MLAHVKYLWYVLRHRWFVMLACFRCGLIWRGLTHDLSKFRPSEWFPYVASFYGPQYPPLQDTHGDARNDALSSGRFKERIRARFDHAWLLHQKRNDHHWQWWILVNDTDGTYPTPMSDRARQEMLADWRGAGRAQGKPDTVGWYMKNRDKMVLHADTRAWIESQLLKGGARW
jgi:hypothetical protein